MSLKNCKAFTNDIRAEKSCLQEMRKLVIASHYLRSAKCVLNISFVFKPILTRFINTCIKMRQSKNAVVVCISPSIHSGSRKTQLMSLSGPSRVKTRIKIARGEIVLLVNVLILVLMQINDCMILSVSPSSLFSQDKPHFLRGYLGTKPAVAFSYRAFRRMSSNAGRFKWSKTMVNGKITKWV